jgi:ribosomal protein L40E
MLFRICVACDHTNPPDSRFCGKCGAPLQVRFCRLCRAANDSVARFCQTCGTELPEIAAPETQAPPATIREPATGEAFVIATPGRPIAESGDAAMPTASTTITSAFAGVEPHPAEPPARDSADSPDGGSAVQIELLPPQSAATSQIIVDGAPAASNLAVMVADSAPAQRRHRLAPAALSAVLLVVIAAVGALALNVWRPPTAADAQRGAADRTDASARDAGATSAVGSVPSAAPTSQGAAAIGTIEAKAGALPSPNVDAAPAPRQVAAPEPGDAKVAPRERREAATRTVERAAVLPPPLPPAMAPRECTDAVAALGLCTPPPKPEGK